MLSEVLFQSAIIQPVIFLIVVVIIVVVIKESRKNPKPQKQQKSNEDIIPYLLKDSVLTQAEFDFAGVLGRYVKGNCIILTKVSLHDVFEVDSSDRSTHQTYFNKISKKHVDFLICDKTTFKPLYAVELDDSSHNSVKAIEKDQFKDKLYATVGLPLVRIKCKREYTPQDFHEITRLNHVISAV